MSHQLVLRLLWVKPEQDKNINKVSSWRKNYHNMKGDMLGQKIENERRSHSVHRLELQVQRIPQNLHCHYEFGSIYRDFMPYNEHLDLAFWPNTLNRFY